MKRYIGKPCIFVLGKVLSIKLNKTKILVLCLRLPGKVILFSIPTSSVARALGVPRKFGSGTNLSVWFLHVASKSHGEKEDYICSVTR